MKDKLEAWFEESIGNAVKLVKPLGDHAKEKIVTWGQILLEIKKSGVCSWELEIAESHAWATIQGLQAQAKELLKDTVTEFVIDSLIIAKRIFLT